MSLTIISVFGAFLGVSLKHMVTLMTTEGANFQSRLSLWAPEVGAASILAFIVFNVYEYTNMFKTLRNRLSWRQALLIGFICGIGVERIFEALKALVGINTGAAGAGG